MSLDVNFLGFHLPNPLVVGAGPLTDDLDIVKSLEDEGAAALVLRPLYEEQVTAEQMAGFFENESYDESFSEAVSFAPEPEVGAGPDEYLEHLRLVKATVGIPVIASLNGSTAGGWTSYARLMEQAGADAVELDLYHAASDSTMSGAAVERNMIEIVTDVKREISIPVAVKLSPMFTAFAHFARQLDAAGADALVLFARFHKVDIDTIELEVIRSLELSNSSDLALRLRGTAALTGRVKADLAVTGGVHSAHDVIKATMTGAHVTQLVSALIKNGPSHLRTLRGELMVWLAQNEWNSLNEMRGNMGFDKIPDPASYERANFRMMFQ